MTIVIPVHRALSTKLAPRGFNVVTRWGYNPWLARVDSAPSSDHDPKNPQLCLRSKSRHIIATRSYATAAAAKPASRPKAHTGRTPAKRSTKAAATSKPGPKTAAGKQAVGRKPKAKPVTKTKAATKTTAKPKKAAVKKPVIKKTAAKRPPSIRALNLERRAKQKDLKERALLNTPKKLAQTPWAVIFGEAQAGKTSASQSAALTSQAAQKLKNLTSEEKEHYNHVANQNKASNITAEKNWLSQFTPVQIREANTARAALRRQYKESHPDAKSVYKYQLIKDDRTVKKPRTAYIQFSADRYASGDFTHMTIAESSKLIGREWKALDAFEKKKFQDQAQADTARYVEEYTTVYGKSPISVGRGSAKATVA